MYLQIKFFVSIVITTVLMVSYACKGPQGDPGPQGATGAIGATGAVGPTGSANVVQITYGSRVYNPIANNELAYTMTGVAADMVTKSAVFMYLQNSSGFWYPIPGIFDGNFEYRTIIRPAANSVIAIRRVQSTSTTNETFSATRIILIPASDLKNGRKAAIDYSNYEEVKRYYNLPD